MDLVIHDFNDVSTALTGARDAWLQLEAVLQQMPLHLKASDQSGIQGRAIFDPVGTNEYVKSRLEALPTPGWRTNVQIPAEFDFLGTDVDFINGSLLVEAQFSNYPFLLNNVIRSELFVKGQVALSSKPISCVVIITKTHIFPASNSTLYYEQAVKQITALANAKVFDVPVRLVGLTAQPGQTVPGVWTEYSASRYSRTVSRRETKQFLVVAPRHTAGRATLEEFVSLPK